MSEYKNHKLEKLKQEISDPWQYDKAPSFIYECIAWTLALAAIIAIATLGVWWWNR